MVAMVVAAAAVWKWLLLLLNLIFEGDLEQHENSIMFETHVCTKWNYSCV